MFVRLFVRLDLSLYSGSQCSGHPDTKARPPTPGRLFPVLPGREVGYGCANYRRDISRTVKIAVKLLFSVNRKSYMPGRLA